MRRASVNSFGFGGSNTHVVVDDALHYLRERNLSGNHCTLTVPENVAGEIPIIDGPLVEFPNSAGYANGPNRAAGPDLSVIGSKTATSTKAAITTTSAPSSSPTETLPRLLVWTAADEQAAKRSIQAYEPFYNEKIVGSRAKLDCLAYTLAARRTHMLWRSFAIVANDAPENQDGTTDLAPVKPMRSSTDATLAFVFTGQGAQYAGMGWDLVQYPVFSHTLQRIDQIYGSFGCKWSIFGKRTTPDF